MKKRMSGEIVEHRLVGPGYYLLVAEAEEIAVQSEPGQFVHVLCHEHYTPFLRRPLSILFAREGRIGLLYKVVGEGTRILGTLGVGDSVDLVGPLGNGFEDGKESRALFVAGGIGVAPLLFLAERFADAGQRVRWVYGAASADDLVLREQVAASGCESEFATIDGSSGVNGTVMDAIEKIYENDKDLPQRVYACGPKPMLAALWDWMEPRGMPGQFSLENRMGCGVGACLGCVIPVRGEKSEYLRVCCDGPVFDAAVVELG